MNKPSLAQGGERFVSLDVFRGLTMAGMILVNNPGQWGRENVYGPLLHASWHGWTPTDLVFPFFLFIVGVAMTFSFDRRLARGHSRLRLFEQVVRRTLIIFLLGLFLAGFPDWRLIGPYVLLIAGLSIVFLDEPPLAWPSRPAERIRKAMGAAACVAAIVWFFADFGYFQESRLRVPGVLQRIALCYFFASLIVMYFGVAGRAVWTVAILAAYWAIYRFAHAPAGYTADVVSSDGLLHHWIDTRVLGSHLYGAERPDPEGLLSTLPAVATTLLGVLTGNWLHARREGWEKAGWLFFVANIVMFAGLWMNHAIPINKKLWTSSYVLLAGGLAMTVLAMCYWLVDVKGRRRWSVPFLVLGTNAIAVYVASGALGRVLLRVNVAGAGGEAVALKTWIVQTGFTPWAPPKAASLLYALSYVAFWMLVFVPLYRRRLFIKV